MNYFLKCLSSLNYIRKRKPSYSFEIQYYKSQQLFLSSCGWAKGVSNRGRTDRGNACFLSSASPLIPVCLSSLCLTAQGFPSLSHLPWAVSWLGTETLFFIPYGGESVHNSFQSLLHPKWFNVMYFSSRHLIFNKKQCAMTERNKRISRVEYQVLETIQKARIRAIYL